MVYGLASGKHVNFKARGESHPNRRKGRRGDGPVSTDSASASQRQASL